MDRWMASAAGGTSHRLNPGWAMDPSRSRKDKSAMLCSLRASRTQQRSLAPPKCTKQKGRNNGRPPALVYTFSIHKKQHRPTTSGRRISRCQPAGNTCAAVAWSHPKSTLNNTVEKQIKTRTRVPTA